MSPRSSIATRLIVLAATAAVYFFAAALGRAAVGVTISPAIITNDYLGKISITVTGLTSGKTIRIEKFADVNGNSVIAPPEPSYLWRSFTVTDGQLPLLAGCTNLNVVGDMDGATNGQIRASNTSFVFPIRWVRSCRSPIHSRCGKKSIRKASPGKLLPAARAFR
ncbi:MAG: hypothetical protein DME26_04880 [Verrucomicrobia bacterium]|nr:MAG: hypothetical protein DME26_04880 [Verrucomicrobiota bacterium]